MTGQSLFYLGETDLQHKILAIAEEEGRPETATPSPALATAGTQAAGGASMAGRG